MFKYLLDYSSLSTSDAEALIKRIESRTADGGDFDYRSCLCKFVVDEQDLPNLQIPDSCILQRIP